MIASRLGRPGNNKPLRGSPPRKVAVVALHTRKRKRGMIENGVKILFLEFQNSLVRMTFQAILIRYWVEHTRWVLVVAQDKFNSILRRRKVVRAIPTIPSSP